ncbi:MAG: hypothetical protein H6719_07340 [Sandaracinaceae bacterium]|nr:hypothetical protein [Sandaracinaceae bacterium]
MDDEELRRLEQEEFFVGYFPMSGPQKRFAWGAVAVAVILVLGAGAAAAWFQRSPGEDLEPYRTSVELDGLLVAAPYPMLRTREPGGEARHVLLVTGSKFVWHPPAERLGHGVRLRGNLIERGGSRMLEVFGHDAADVEGLDALAAVTAEPVGEVTLVGEIVDSKCYLGRMRPGGGRTHRACAQLCVSGGIPPVLVTRGPAGETHYLLASEAGGSVADDVLPFVAEPVRVRGSLERLGSDLRILRIDPTDIERL